MCLCYGLVCCINFLIQQNRKCSHIYEQLLLAESRRNGNDCNAVICPNF